MSRKKGFNLVIRKVDVEKTKVELAKVGIIPVEIRERAGREDLLCIVLPKLSKQQMESFETDFPRELFAFQAVRM